MKTTLALLALAVPAAMALAPMPAATTMSRGFDMVKGTQNGTQVGKELLPIYTFHYTMGQTYTDPSDPSISWSVPDELVATDIDTSTELINEGIQNSYTDWIHTKLANFNVNAGVKAGNGTKAMTLNFKYNHESYTYKEISEHDSAASGFSKHEWATFSLESYPPQFMTLNPFLSREISALPASVNSGADQAKYNQLVEYWGTHFPTWCNFGGHVHVNTFVNKSFIQKHSNSWVQNQFSLTFHYYMFDISGGGYVNKSDIHISNEFKEAATTYIFFKGGDITLQNNNTVNEWVKTIPHEPLYLNVTMSDLSVLVTDSGKAMNLQKTIKSYIDTGRMPPTDDTVDYQAFYDAIEVEDRDEVPMPSNPNARFLRSKMDRNLRA